MSEGESNGRERTNSQGKHEVLTENAKIVPPRHQPLPGPLKNIVLLPDIIADARKSLTRLRDNKPAAEHKIPKAGIDSHNDDEEPEGPSNGVFPNYQPTPSAAPRLL